MAQVNYDPTPDVENQGGLAVQADASAFGGDVARATQGLGQDLMQAGVQFSNVAIAKAETANELYANDKNTEALQSFTDLWSQYSKLEGKAAQDALPAYQAAVNDIYKNTIESAPNTSARMMLLKPLSFAANTARSRAVAYSDQQFKVWQDRSAINGAKEMAAQAALEVNNPEQMNAYLAGSDAQIRKLYEDRGWDRASVAMEVKKNRSSNVNLIIKETAVNDPQKAIEIYNANAGNMTAEGRLLAQSVLKPVILDGQATAIVDQQVKGATPAEGAEGDLDRSGLPNKGVALDRVIKATQGNPALQNAAVAKLNRMYEIENANYVDEQRRIKIEKDQAKAASDNVEAEAMKDLFGDNPTISVKDIVNSPVLEREAKTRLIGIADRLLSGEPAAARSREATVDLLGRMRLPDGDPRKITDTAPIYDAFIEKKSLSKSDFGFLMKEFTDSRTVDGDRFSKRKADFVDSVRPRIDKSNPLQGVIVPEGKQEMYQFEWDLDQRISQYRKEGKNPYDLLDPSKPDYFGRAESIASYEKSVATSIRENAEKLRRGMVTPSAAGAPAPVKSKSDTPPRKAGETPQQYLDRINGAKIPNPPAGP